MGKTIMGAVVSLDGFMADDNDEVGPLFDWYGNGDVAWSFPGSDGESRSTQASADFMRSHYRNMATVVIGRRLFDMTNGWNGKPAAGNMSSSSPISRRRTGSMPAPHRSLSSMTLRRPSRLPRSFPATGMLTWRRVRSEARRSSSGSSTRWSSTRSRWSSARGGRSSPLVPWRSRCSWRIRPRSCEATGSLTWCTTSATDARGHEWHAARRTNSSDSLQRVIARHQPPLIWQLVAGRWHTERAAARLSFPST
jgi:hypothetical protein